MGLDKYYGIIIFVIQIVVSITCIYLLKGQINSMSLIYLNISFIYIYIKLLNWPDKAWLHYNDVEDTIKVNGAKKLPSGIDSNSKYEDITDTSPFKYFPALLYLKNTKVLCDSISQSGVQKAVVYLVIAMAYLFLKDTVRNELNPPNAIFLLIIFTAQFLKDYTKVEYQRKLNYDLSL